MPIKTDTGSSPYFDDYNQENDFYKILFKPGVPVQVRELNQLQTIVQKQIERFGDNIFKRGTIVDGCAFTFHDNVPYVKIKDTETDGSPVVPPAYTNAFIRNSANLQAFVLASNTGFETQDPDLNTLYLRYINTSTNGQVVFESGEVLTVSDSNNSVYEVSISDGGTSFSNTDVPLFLSAIAVQNTTGGKSFTNSTGGACTFTIGHNLIGGTSSANVIIVGVDTTSNNDSVILTIRPQYNDLTAATANAAAWTVLPNENISTNATNNGVRNAIVQELVGSGATATIVTDGTGTITTVTITNRGSGYIVPPYTTVISPTGTPSTLNITAENYIGKITVSSLASSVGNGYGFTIGDGVIYQLGYFARVDEQFIIVDKYSNAPDNKSVGFKTIESIINSNVDPSLLDNALGTFNYTAPGADRLNLTPTLEVLDTDDARANNDFFPIVGFSAGTPYQQNRYTQYEVIEQEMARRTYDESGNYVLDNFLATSVSSNTIITEANTFDIVIDPGKAYINGYRVETFGNYRAGIEKGVDTDTANSVSLTVSYGNYIRVRGVAGVFLFSTGDIISLRDTAKTFLSTNSNYGSTPTAPGVEIGKARIRSMSYESGVPGTPDAVYRLYLFNVAMNAGKNFKNVRSAFYNGATYDAVADIVLDTDVTSGLPVAQLQETKKNNLLFYSGIDAVKNITNITYQYRTQQQTGLSSNTQGRITVTLTDTSETHPYIGNLTSNEKEDVIIIPLANAEQSTVATGTVTVTTSGNTAVANAATAFLTDFKAGDYVKISANSTGGYDYRRITSIANSTYLTFDSNPSFANVAATLTLAFPQYIPIPFASRTNRTGNVSVNGKTLTLDLGLQTGNTLTGNTAVAVAYNVKVTNATPIAKTANRNLYVRINCSNNTGNTIGPWSVGVPDIFRLKNVYLGGNNTFLSSDTGVTDVTRHFVIDHNQKSSEYNIGYLYLKPTERFTLSSSDRLLVKFDAFTNGTEATLFCAASYSVNNTTELASLTTDVNTVEIPEMVTSQGVQIDLRDYFDFRPVVANTVALVTTEAGAPVHPPRLVANAAFGNTADPANNRKFPVPDSDVVYDVEYYLGRKDIVSISKDGEFNFTKGVPSQKPVEPTAPPDSLVIDVLNIPPFPSLPLNKSASTINLLNKRVINQKELTNRESIFTVKSESQNNPVKYAQTPAFTMKDIKSLQSRIEQLEYYSTLSLIEDKVKKEVIPSAANSQVDRFKFGYFVDNFTSTTYADIQDIEFHAETNADRATLVPSTKQLSFKYKPYGNTVNISTFGNIILLPYDEVSVVSQLQATTKVAGESDSCAVTPTPDTGRGKIETINPPVFQPHAPAHMFAVYFTSPVFQRQVSTGDFPKSADLGNSFFNLSNTFNDRKLTNKGQKFYFKITGLRPLTVFTFYFDQKDKTTACQPKGGKRGDTLRSNAQGVLQFNFYLEYLNAVELIDISVLTNSPYHNIWSGMPGPVPLYQPPPGTVVSSDKLVQLYQGTTVAAKGVIPVTLTFDK